MALEVKVVIVAKDQTKKFRFNQEMSVSEVCAEIKEKAGVGGADHGLFMKADDSAGRKAGWLSPEKTMLFYGVKSGDTLIFRKRHRPQKVKLADDTVKTILIDESQTVYQLTKVVAELLGLKNEEEFSLKVEGQNSWLHPQQTLPEQGVDEKATLVLRKKFFSSDATVDRSDPVQLHYLYTQCKDMVVSGQLPTTYDEATQLAGLQLQVDYGNFVPENHRYGWFQDRLEQIGHFTHTKQKTFDKDVLQHWKQVTGMTQINAKFRYVQMVRSLKTYGITCFEVEEKAPKGFRKILLGIAAEKIYRMDYNTKEVLSQHSVTHLRRYAAGPKSLTLDFADYEGDYSTFKTDQGEVILQMISGYIDIFLKKRKSTGVVVKDDEAESAEVSEVAPVVGYAATSFTSNVGVNTSQLLVAEQSRMTSAGARPAYSAVAPGASTEGRVSRQNQRKSVFGTAADSIEANPELMRELDPFLDLLDFADADLARSALGDEDWRKMLAESMGLAGVQAEEFMQMLKNNPDKVAIYQKQQQMLHSMADLIRSARMAATESEEDISLLEGAKHLATAIARMLQTQKMYGSDDPRSIEAARAVLAARTALQVRLDSQALADQASEELIMAYAHAVDGSAQRLLDDARKNKLDSDAAQLEAQKEAFAQNAQILSRAALNPACKTLLVQVTEKLSGASAQVKKDSAGLPSEQARNDLAAATAKLDRALKDFLTSLDCASALDQQDPVALAHSLQDALDLIKQSRVDKGGLQRGTKDALVAGSKLVRAYQESAENLELEEKNAVLERLTAVTLLLKTEGALSKEAVAKIGDVPAHQALVANGRRLQDAVEDLLVADGAKAVAFKELADAAKRAAAATAHLVDASRDAAAASSDPAAAAKINQDADRAAAAVPVLLQNIKAANAKPTDGPTQLAFAAATRKVGPDAAVLIADSNAFIPKVKDIAQKTKLRSAAADAYTAIEDMLKAAEKVSSFTGAADLERSALAADIAQAQLDALLFAAREGVLPPNNASASDAKQAIATSAEDLRRVTERLVAVQLLQPRELRENVQATGASLAALSAAIERLAPQLPKTAQAGLIENGKRVVGGTRRELLAVRATLANPAAQAELDEAARALQEMLKLLLGTVRASDACAAECARASKAVANLSADQPTKYSTFAIAVEDLDGKAKLVAASLVRVVTDANGDDEGLMAAARSVQIAWKQFTNSAAGVLAVCPAGQQGVITKSLQLVSQAAGTVVDEAKKAHENGNFTPLDPALQAATAATRQLLSDARSLSPESKGYALVIDTLTAAVAALAAGTSPALAPEAADDPIKYLNDNLKDLNTAMAKLAASTNPEEAVVLARTAARAVENALAAVGFVAANTTDAAAAQALRQGGQELGKATLNAVQLLQNVGGKPRDAATQAQIVEQSEAVTDKIQTLRELIPGQRECDVALLDAHSALAALDNAILAASAGALGARGSVPLHEAEERVIRVLTALTAQAAGLSATTNKPLQMVPYVAGVGKSLTEFTAATEELVKASDPSAQQDRLTAAKTVAARALTVVKVAKSCRNDSSAALRASLAQASKDLSDDLRKLLSSLQHEAEGLRMCDAALAALAAASASLQQPVVKSKDSYQVIRLGIESASKALVANTANGLLQGAKSGNMPVLSAATKSLGDTSVDLVARVRLAAAATADPAVQKKLLSTATEYTNRAITLVKDSKAFLEAPKNDALRSNLSSSFQTLATSMAALTAAVQEGATGELDCAAAIAQARNINNDLDEAILFSATGGFDGHVDPRKTLRDYHTAFLQDSNALAASADKVAAAAHVNIEELGAASRQMAQLLTSLNTNSKACAYLVENIPAQQAMLGGTRDVSVDVYNLLSGARELQLSQGPDNVQALAARLKPAVAALQNAVGTAAAPQLARLKEISAAEEKVAAASNRLASDTDPGNAQATPEDIVRAIRVVAASYVAVSNEAADDAMRLKAIQDLGASTGDVLLAVKGALRLTTDADLRRRLLGLGKSLAADILALLGETARIEDTAESVKRINAAIPELVAATRKLPGGEDLSLEDNDLERQAELELQRAAQQIADAAERISKAREAVSTDEDYKGLSLADQDIAAAILDAAKAIARATAILVQAATVSQKELLAKGKANKALNPYKKDPAWANGYISAAKAVSATVDELVQTANDAAKKKVGQEHLVAASRAVAGTTARFVYASKVKSDPSSPTTQKLEEASKATAAATLALVNAAKEAGRRKDEAQYKVEIDASKDAAQQLRKQEFELQVEIATLERELEEARKKLSELRKNEYLKDSQGMTLSRAVAAPHTPSPGSLRRAAQAQSGKAGTKEREKEKEKEQEREKEKEKDRAARAATIAAKLAAAAAPPPASALPPPSGLAPPPPSALPPPSVLPPSKLPPSK